MGGSVLLQIERIQDDVYQVTRPNAGTRKVFACRDTHAVPEHWFTYEPDLPAASSRQVTVKYASKAEAIGAAVILLETEA